MKLLDQYYLMVHGRDESAAPPAACSPYLRSFVLYLIYLFTSTPYALLSQRPLVNPLQSIRYALFLSRRRVCPVCPLSPKKGTKNDPRIR